MTPQLREDVAVVAAVTAFCGVLYLANPSATGILALVIPVIAASQSQGPDSASGNWAHPRVGVCAVAEVSEPSEPLCENLLLEVISRETHGKPVPNGSDGSDRAGTGCHRTGSSHRGRRWGRSCFGNRRIGSVLTFGTIHYFFCATGSSGTSRTSIW
jgi:hypothetical protein